MATLTPSILGRRCITSVAVSIHLLCAVGQLSGADENDKDGKKLPSYRYPQMPGFSRMPYLQMSGPESMSIVWRTEKAMTPVVRFGKDLKNLDRKCDGADIIVKQKLKDLMRIAGPPPKSDQLPLFTAPDGTHQYEASLKGLSPSTRYFYAIFDGEERLTPEDPSFFLETHPVPGTDDELLFWVVGDSGTGEQRQQDVHQAMIDYVSYNNLDLDLYVHVGDMAYSSGKDDEFQEHFFEMYEPTLRNTACWPAMGNHEGGTSKGQFGYGPYYDSYIVPTKAEIGGEPSGTEAYYSFDYAKVHFIVLDSFDLDRRPVGAMAQWLQTDLEKTHADWIVAFWHHPPYTKGSHDSDREEDLIEMRQYIQPILEAGGVDLCLTGHSHIYERSMLMDGAYETPTTNEDVILDDNDGDPHGDGPYRKSAGLPPNNGHIQVVAGHGGTRLSRKGTMNVMKRILLEHGSVLIQVSGNTLTGTMIDYKGYERDVFSIVKEGVVAPIRIAQPWERPPFGQPELANHYWEGGSLPADYEEAVKKHSEWKYLAGAHPPEAWAGTEFDDSAWLTGAAGFGFGDRDDTTVLGDMKGKYTAVYLRKEFEVKTAQDAEELTLAVAYDDGFIAYLNGVEMARANVTSGSGPDAVVDFSREAQEEYQTFSFRNVRDSFRFDAPNVLAIEAHNRSVSSDDFTIDPFIAVLPPKKSNPDKLFPLLYEYVTGLNEKWSYFASKQEPPARWMDEDFDVSKWPKGRIGFGYGDGDDVTVLKDMEKNYTRAYFRTEFTIKNEDDYDSLGLAIRYDDAFIAYINGKEVLRVGIDSGRGQNAKGIAKHDADEKKDKYDYFSLAHARHLLSSDGPNIIAIEGHNVDLQSSDFTIDPILLLNRDKSQPMPEKFTELIPKNAEWRYVAGKGAAPEDGWEKPDFKTSDWAKGESGFGYGEGADARTALDDMKENFRVVYMRKTFDLDDPKLASKIGLAVRFDDAFIAYLNGKEILRRNVETGRGEKAEKFTGKQKISKDFEYFPLGSQKDAFVDGQNVIAIEGHNQAVTSSDFIIDAFLVVKDE
ncbi:MAG: metallophosphoesterase [Verrucomicrobiae bacterium]|nr:metallophosphoesterase [Verrucomicrobiae bacterium]